MDFEDILSSVGDFGRYQRLLLCFICVPVSFFVSVEIHSHILVSAIPEHHCHISLSAEEATLLNQSLALREVRREGSVAHPFSRELWRLLECLILLDCERRIKNYRELATLNLIQC